MHNETHLCLKTSCYRIAPNFSYHKNFVIFILSECLRNYLLRIFRSIEVCCHMLTPWLSWIYRASSSSPQVALMTRCHAFPVSHWEASTPSRTKDHPSFYYYCYWAYVCDIPSRTNETIILQAFSLLRSLLCATR